MTTRPSAADQLLFLSRVQRLLDSGRFSATYKFALFLSLAELAVELGDDSGASLRLPLDLIAERFITLYWRQASPYRANGQTTVLRQNTGQQAAIIRRITEAHRSLGVSLGSVKAHAEWPSLLRRTRQLVIRMPLLRLQTIGRDGQSTSAECFLYENSEPESDLELYPGVGFCLRCFFPLIQGMVRAKWLGWVQAQNSDALGAVQDLESFMFGADRGDVRTLVGTLLELQNGHCFYKTHIRLSPTTAQVDHFIPWAKYPCDAVANLVLASPIANSSKRDHLPATEYLRRWHERNARYQAVLAKAARTAGVESGEGSVQRVAAWAYGSHAAIGGLVWDASEGLIPLSTEWEPILSA